MARNGSGTYSLPAGNPVVAGQTITDTWANTTLSDIATALTNSIAKDGQTVPTANLPMGGFKLTGLGAGTTAGDALRYQQRMETVLWDGATGDGTTNDRAAIVAAQTAGRLFFPPGTYAVATALTITGNCTFLPGAKLKPASGVTITITGAVSAGMYQIFDTSAGGHVDLTGCNTAVGLVEWWGVIGGDAAYDGTNATANKPLIDEVITYGPYELWWKQPGIYSTTGHVLSVRHKHVGLGKSQDNCIYGDGIVFSDNAHMVSQGATLAGKKYVFQNGLSGTPQEFESLSILGDTTDCIPLGILPSTAGNMEWQYTARNCLFRGYIGRHLGWANGNHWDSCWFIGNFAATADTIWDDDSGDTTAYGYVQKQVHTSCQFEQTQVASGQLLYQDRVGSASPTSNVIADNRWEGCFFEYGYNGMVLAGIHQAFDSAHMENLAGSYFVSEAADYDSHWENVGIYKGAGSLDPGSGVAALGYLADQLSAQSSIYPFVGTTTTSLTGCTTVPTSVVNWSVDENRVVNLNVRGVGGTSNSTSKTLGTLPTYIRPAREKWFTFFASDNGGAYVAALGVLGTNGVMTLYATAGAGSWTNSGAATVSDFTVSYSLD